MPASRTGRNWVAATSPTIVPDPVSCRTSQDCATTCIQVPGRLIACPAAYRRKFRTRSAASSAPALPRSSAPCRAGPPRPAFTRGFFTTPPAGRPRRPLADQRSARQSPIIEWLFYCWHERRRSLGLVAVPGALSGGPPVGAGPGHRELVAVRLPRRAERPGPRPPVRPLRGPRVHRGLVPAQARPAPRDCRVTQLALKT